MFEVDVAERREQEKEKRRTRFIFSEEKKEWKEFGDKNCLWQAQLREENRKKRVKKGGGRNLDLGKIWKRKKELRWQEVIGTGIVEREKRKVQDTASIWKRRKN